MNPIAHWATLRLMLVGRGADKPEASALLVLNMLEIEKPPVDVHALVKALGIEVSVRDSLNDSAAMDALSEIPAEGSGAPACIQLEHVGEHRERFTLAHALGHILLHHRPRVGGTIRFTDAGLANSSPEETSANAFASELLMPRLMVAECWAKNPDPAAIAEMLCVPKAAVEHRLRLMRLV